MVHKAFAYLDVDHPIVAWAVYRGTLVSVAAVGSAPTASHRPVSMMFAGMIQHQANARFQNELLIDAVRRQRYAHQVSRLTGMYFFTDHDEAKAAQNWGAYFRAESLSEVAVYSASPRTRVDANWITAAPLDTHGRLEVSDLSWIDCYWMGRSCDNRPVWETIVHGRATVLGTELRRRAYDVLADRFPDALDTLEVSRLAAEVDSDLGQTVALMQQIADDRYRIDYFLDMRAAEEPGFLDRLAKHHGATNIRDLQPGKPTFGLPDFRPFSCEFTISQEVDSGTGYSLPTVHRQVDI